MTRDEIKTDFERKLSELGLSFNLVSSNCYQLTCITQPTHIHFFVSKPITDRNVISPNGNLIDFILHFKLVDLNEFGSHDYCVMAYQYKGQDPQYIIVPSQELLRRIRTTHISPSKKNSVELVFWLMDDINLYETKGLSPEGEWYYLSKGVSGRMGDHNDLSYTAFLNCWNQILTP